MTAPTPVLTDGYVTLRAHSEDDLDDIVEACRDPQSQRWTTVPEDYTLDDAKRWVRDIAPDGWETGRDWGFAIEALDQETGRRRFAGNCALRSLGSGRSEVAFLGHPWARGTGIMQRAVRLLLEWGFAECGLKTVVWYAHVGNWASRRLAWKLGFTYGGVLQAWSDQRGELRDCWSATLTAGQPMAPATRWLETPEYRGERVALRPIMETDVPRIVEACNDERTLHWLGMIPSPFSEADARSWLQDNLEDAALARRVTWAIAGPGSDALLGVVNIFDLGSHPVAEVGYWVHPDARGRGVATEATRLALRHAFLAPQDGGLGLSAVRARAALGNDASQRVLTGAGMKPAGTQRRSTLLEGGVRADAAFFDCVAEEFTAEG